MTASTYTAMPLESGRPDALSAAIGWMTGTIVGSIATALCVIAIAAVGFLMLQGRLPVREGARVVLGCFVLLGAPVIAAAFMNLGQAGVGYTTPPPTAIPADQRAGLPPSNYDPYAGASVRQD